MVVQKSNWHEMSKMLELADQFNAHEVIFNRITDWNTYEKFKEQLPPEQNELFVKEFEFIKRHPKTISWSKLN